MRPTHRAETLGNSDKRVTRHAFQADWDDVSCNAAEEIVLVWAIPPISPLGAPVCVRLREHASSFRLDSRQRRFLDHVRTLLVPGILFRVSTSLHHRAKIRRANGTCLWRTQNY